MSKVTSFVSCSFRESSADTEHVSIDKHPETPADSAVEYIFDQVSVGGSSEQQAQLSSLLKKYAFEFAN